MNNKSIGSTKSNYDVIDEEIIHLEEVSEGWQL